MTAGHVIGAFWGVAGMWLIMSSEWEWSVVLWGAIYVLIGVYALASRGLLEDEEDDVH